ncbi:hemerythrin domain-containing protein [Streptomyces sp. NPDC059385]|uniref:hemerythrin domain-containing protein n=1 Tax=Streptomyces sp. NPDC059385 TaxID=3346817 RepID=UPI0036959297
MSTDAIVMLRDDHKKIRKLIHTYRADSDQVLSSAGDGPQETVAPGEIVRELLHELTVHTFVEDEVMYPQVRQLVPETASLVLKFHEEHHVANVLAAELEGMKQDDESFDAKTRVLMDAVERHMDVEEKEWFPQVREALGRKALQFIGSRMAEVRKFAPQRPHKPLLRKLADAMAS